MRSSFLLVALAGAAAHGLWADGKPSFQIHGQGWIDGGRIMRSSDSLLNDGSGDAINVTGAALASTGAQFTAVADLGDNLEGAFGFGAYSVSHTLGTYNGLRQPLFLSISLFKNYLTEARLTYFAGDKSAPGFSATVGSFAYDYNPDAKDLGLYLLRGPVYPGLLMGGFEDFSADTSKSNVLGARLHHAAGNFSQDLIFKNEQDLPPTFDWSLAYVAKYNAFGAVQIGAGVNLYRLIPYDSRLETPGHLDSLDRGRSIDTTGSAGDSSKWVYYTHRGVKLMGMFSVDFKRWIPSSSLGADDLKLYGEAAVLGVTNYGTYYHDIARRIPVMAGFNLPVFGFLDYLSVEAEWYGSRYRDDLATIGNLNGVADWTTEPRPTPSPTPVRGAYADSTRDNWKWAVFAEKTVKGHVRFTAQIADDHYRPRPISTQLINAAGGTAEAFTTPKDWYFMFRMGFLF